MVKPGAPSALEESRFKALLSTVTSSLPDDASLRSQVGESLEKQWNNPRHEGLNEVLGTAGDWTPKSARQLMFFPTTDQASMYARLIRDAPAGAPSNHPQTSMQSGHMVMLYLHHVPHLPWGSFAAPFITGGGLSALASLMQSPNLYLRGQAIDSFLQITAGSASVFDWWSPPVTGSTDKALHDAMIGLASIPQWMEGLLLNSDAATSYPGGPVQSLQLLAFWLSWVRKLHSSNSRIYLSRTLLAALRDWGAAGMSGTECVDEPLSEELLELRSKLFADFSREGPIEGAVFTLPGGAQQHVQWGDSPADDMHTVATDVTQMSSTVPTAVMEPVAEEAEDVIELGDEGFDISADDNTAAVANNAAATPSPSPPPPPTSGAASMSAKATVAKPPPSLSSTAPASAQSAPASAQSAPSRDFSVVQPVRLSAREQGNSAFAAERFQEALQFYDQALDELEDEKLEGDLGSEAGSGGAEAVLLCNRATVLLSLHEQEVRVHSDVGAEGGSEEAWEAVAEGGAAIVTAFVRKCEEAARAAIAADGSYFKAHYRLSQALEQQGKLHEAIRAAQAALACNGAHSASSLAAADSRKVGNAEDKAKGATKGKPAAGIPQNARRTIEKLLVSLMERLVRQAEEQTANAAAAAAVVAMGGATSPKGKENWPADETTAGPANGGARMAEVAEEDDEVADSAAYRQAKTIEREASIMCKILRRKDAHTRHDKKFAKKTNASEGSTDAIQTGNGLAVSQGFLSAESAVEGKGKDEKTATKEQECGALVPRSLSQAVVSTRDEWDDETVGRGLEMMKDTGSDSDDDMHVFNAKQKAKARAERAEVKVAKLAEKKAARKAAGANVESVLASAGELGLGGSGAAKGERVPKKAVNAEKGKATAKMNAKTSTKPKVATKKEKAAKADKKSQIADLKKMAGGGVSSSLLADLA